MKKWLKFIWFLTLDLLLLPFNLLFLCLYYLVGILVIVYRIGVGDWEDYTWDNHKWIQEWQPETWLKGNAYVQTWLRDNTYIQSRMKQAEIIPNPDLSDRNTLLRGAGSKEARE